MRVVVRLEESCRPALTRWRQELSANAVDQAALSQVYLDELKKRLIQSGGFPRFCLVVRSQPEPHFWVELSGNMWVCYTVSDGGRFTSRSRTIHVLEARPSPPAEAAPTFPPA